MDHSQTVYVLLEKMLEDERIRVVGVYSDFELATEVMEDHMSIFEELAAYKIEAKSLVNG